jgi:predicted transcriptional regulator
MSNSRFTLDQYAAALRQAGGNRAAAAASLGCTVSAIHSIVRSHPELKALCAPRPPSAGLSRRYRPDQVADALRQAGGNQTHAARLLGCWRQTVVAYIERYPEVKAALDQARRKGPPSPVGRIYARRYSPEKVIEALHKAGGIKSRAAELLHCTRATVDAYIQRYPEVREEWIETRETLVDAAQSKLYDAVERGEWRAVRFVLLTMGKDRGFTMRPTPTPKESATAEYERRWAKFEADIRKVYGDSDKEDD